MGRRGIKNAQKVKSNRSLWQDNNSQTWKPPFPTTLRFTQKDPFFFFTDLISSPFLVPLALIFLLLLFFVNKIFRFLFTPKHGRLRKLVRLVYFSPPKKLWYGYKYSHICRAKHLTEQNFPAFRTLNSKSALSRQTTAWYSISPATYATRSSIQIVCKRGRGEGFIQAPTTNENPSLHYKSLPSGNSTLESPLASFQ